ncbi:MAG: preprotein translocase subunit SecE [Phycisphaeraceae bacterium]|nr:preprotein translocase subunit SecE [Phycisphaerales bacterium]MCB9841805.1 preprotein translocase subunit SecE [Phycisphaeraceae bacterium]
MSFTYKPSQGYWTRLMSAIAGGTLALAAGSWAWAQLDAVDVKFERVYLQGGVLAAILLVSAILIFWLVYRKPSSSEFLIATEGEMKKVNWSSRREIFGSTWVVIAISVIIAVLLFVVDMGFHAIFKAIGVLDA